MHSDSKTYKCNAPGCDAKFSLKTLLKNHYDYTHLGIRYSCEVPGCESILGARSTYMGHLREVHKSLNKSEFEKLMEKWNFHEKPRLVKKPKAPRKKYKKSKKAKKAQA